MEKWANKQRAGSHLDVTLGKMCEIQCGQPINPSFFLLSEEASLLLCNIKMHLVEGREKQPSQTDENSPFGWCLDGQSDNSLLLWVLFILTKTKWTGIFIDWNLRILVRHLESLLSVHVKLLLVWIHCSNVAKNGCFWLAQSVSSLRLEQTQCTLEITAALGEIAYLLL